MAILEKEVKVNTDSFQKYYEELGYTIPRRKDKKGRYCVQRGTKILVKIKDLPVKSGVKVTKICDDCGEYIPDQNYNNIMAKRIQTDGKDRCHRCACKFGGLKRKRNVKYESSLENYAKVNGKRNLLIEFSKKNRLRPSEIHKSTKDKYIWNCSECKNEYEMSVGNKTYCNLGCPYCSSRRINSSNCLWSTHPKIAAMMVNKDIGFKVSHGSHKRVEFRCSDCNLVSSKNVYKVVHEGKVVCKQCSDGISYPEKFLLNILNQTGIKVEREKVFDWSKNVKTNNVNLCGRKRYDFYIPSLNMIIETHGLQHYEEHFVKLGGKPLKDVHENDKIKKELALINGITHYITIDCQRSEMNYIKNNILSSSLTKLFDLNNVKWEEAHNYACKTIVRTVCDLWNEGYDSTTKIENRLGIDKSTINRYLKQGKILGWCNYDPNIIKIKNGVRTGKGNSKRVIQLSKTFEFIKEWESITLASKSLSIVGSSISGVCKHKLKTAGGYKWMYKEDYDKYIEQKNLKMIN